MTDRIYEVLIILGEDGRPSALRASILTKNGDPMSLTERWPEKPRTVRVVLSGAYSGEVEVANYLTEGSFRPIEDGDALVECPVCLAAPGQQCSDSTGQEWAGQVHRLRGR